MENRLVTTTPMERIKVLSLHNRPSSRAKGRDGVREPTPRNEEALVGVDVRTIREAKTLGPVFSDSVVHALGIFKKRLGLGGVTSILVLLRESLSHVDSTEGPFSRPDVVGGFSRTILAEGISVSNTSDGAVDVVASPVLDILPDLVGSTGTEVLVDHRLTHNSHTPSLAIDSETTEDIKIDGEVT